MRVVYDTCCGIDVHKKVLVATIVTTDNKGISTYLQESFSTFNYDLQRLHDWLIEHDCHHVCMESTGKYWIPVFNYLESDIHVCLTHPKYVRAIKGRKTDKKDSKWIADLYKFDLVRSSFIPPEDFRQLREIARYRVKLNYMKTAEKNRIQNSMTVSNIGIDKVFSDPFGRSAKDIMTHVLEHSSGPIDRAAIAGLIRKNTKASVDEIVAAIEGSRIRSDQRLKLSLARDHLEYLERLITRTEVELFVRMQPYQEYVDLVQTIPGMTALSSTIVLAEVGVDMSVFEDSRHLTSWAGLAPGCNESANKKKSVRIMKAGAYLKPLMVQCALAAIKCKKQPYFSIKYSKIRKRRGHKKAIIAVARMMMVCLYHIVRDKKAFSPNDYDELVNPEEQPKKVVLNEANVFEFLAQHGYDTTVLVKCNES